MRQFPPEHQAAFARAVPGSSISTDVYGTTISPPRTFQPCKVLSDKSPTNLTEPGSPFSKIWFATYANPTKKIIQPGVIVVCIDGACTNNGTASARAGLGVFFGPESPFNLSERVIDGPQTSQRAEIRAAVRALQTAQTALKGDMKINRVVLLTDSAYLAQAMTEWIHAWKNNGWKGANGSPVVNAKDFKELDALIEVMEEDGLAVDFWRVGREYNTLADGLATSACES